MVDLLRKSSFLLFNKLHFCTMTPTESTPIGVLFSLAPPPVPERSTLRAEGAKGGRISFEILPTRAVRLEVCRMVRCPKTCKHVRGSQQEKRSPKVVSFLVFSFFPLSSPQRHPFATVSSNVVGTDGENCYCNSPQFDAAAANLLLQGVAVRIFLFLQTFSIPKHPTHSPPVTQ